MDDNTDSATTEIDYDTDELDDVIFDFLQEGRTPQSMMYQRTKFSKQDFFYRLQQLRKMNLIWKVHKGTATYELIADPRDPEEIEKSMESRDFLPSREYKESEDLDDSSDSGESSDVDNTDNSPNTNNGTEHSPGHEGQ